MMDCSRKALVAALATASLLSACATPNALDAAERQEAVRAPTFEKDRSSILAMAGNFAVTFDFTETVPLAEGYQLKDPKLSGGHEVVRVVEDRGDFISLQHLLVVGPDENPFVVKHWRQDWQFEPERVLVFIGGNAWEWRDVPATERKGVWSQTVYQVDDAPRYGAIGRWSYEDGLAQWTPPQEWRPLPRRDMTTRDDYHAIDAVNRHVITPWGWAHEQDNSKLVLAGEPRALVREVGVNTYRQFSDFPIAAADAYWESTAAFWAGVRAEWTRIVSAHDRFAITIKGETEALYNPLLGLAMDVREGEKSVDLALSEARGLINGFVTDDVGELSNRLRPTSKPSETY